MLQKITCTLLLFALSLSMAVAQDSIPVKSIVFPTLKAKKYKVRGLSNKVLTFTSLDSLKGNILYGSGKKGPQQVSIELINRLGVAQSRRQVLRGMGLGILGGGATGALIGRMAYVNQENTFWYTPGLASLIGATLGTLGGTIVGAIVGNGSYRYNYYDLSIVPLSKKQAFISNILLAR